MNIAFESDRLRVYAADVIPSDQCVERRVYLAFRRDIDCPYPVATLTVWVDSPEIISGPGASYVEMVSVVEPHRRQGIASELWRAVGQHLGRELVGDPVSDAGEALMQSLEREATDAR